MNIKPIETIYNGYRFRSRAEARWAVFFDACKIQYMYEPEGFRLSDGTLYLPDFYLPESKTYFEVKGIMSDADMHKIKQLQKDLCVSVAIGYADMTFQSSDNYDWGGSQTFEIASKDESYIVKCPDCGKVFFMASTGYYGCQCCGYYDGDSIFSHSCCGDGKWFGHSEEFKGAFNIAKQARFEHGEHGKSLSGLVVQEVQEHL